jgi:hypothetical protein
MVESSMPAIAAVVACPNSKTVPGVLLMGPGPANGCQDDADFGK